MNKHLEKLLRGTALVTFVKRNKIKVASLKARKLESFRVFFCLEVNITNSGHQSRRAPDDRFTSNGMRGTDIVEIRESFHITTYPDKSGTKTCSAQIRYRI
jgi:hypothetical protein